MRAQGGPCVVRSEDMAFMGFVDVLKNYRTIRDNARKEYKFSPLYQPDILICVDYAGFCFRYILPHVRNSHDIDSLLHTPKGMGVEEKTHQNAPLSYPWYSRYFL